VILAVAVDNEKTKLVANALDRASTGCLTVGVFAPLAALVYAPIANVTPSWNLAIGAFVWFFAAALLHIEARRTLGGLK
jgi:hypothetical protein